MAADITAADGLPRFVWTDAQFDPFTYRTVILNAIAEQQRWRTQYEAAKTTTASVDGLSAPASRLTTTSSASDHTSSAAPTTNKPRRPHHPQQGDSS